MNKLFQDTLFKMKDRLAKSGYGVHRRQLHRQQPRRVSVGITSRFGYPTISLQMEGVTGAWGDFLQVGRGRDDGTQDEGLFDLRGGRAAIPFKDAESFQVFGRNRIV